jgi:thiosulfate/3-mercaptopyruvate sulfurtransferase
MRYTTLIETGQLASSLADPSWAIVDCRFDLKDTSAGERAYEAAHVPGAVYAHVDRDLSGQKSGANGRHPLPDSEVFVETVARLGIDAATQVVVYDQDTGGFASRLWWMLRWMGHDAVALLNGGFARWTAEGRPTRPGVEVRNRRQFVAHPRPEMVVTAADVAALAGRTDWRLVDARAPERFRGEVEPIDRVPGHIPGAVNVPFQENIDAPGTFRSPESLAERFRSALEPVDPSRVVNYCGSGVTACQNILALEHAGLHGSKLYAGSWSEWSSDPSRPVARSDESTSGT